MPPKSKAKMVDKYVKITYTHVPKYKGIPAHYKPRIVYVNEEIVNSLVHEKFITNPPEKS